MRIAYLKTISLKIKIVILLKNYIYNKIVTVLKKIYLTHKEKG